jgi:AcrR family transcriptional regulator
VPRHADPALEQRILKAARRLWKRGGEHALTMRSVAKEARTTTPTVYERFRNRRQILLALCLDTRQKLFDVLKGTTSTREACEVYLEFAAKHPHEYELLSAGWSKPPSANDQWPSFNLFKERTALRCGGKPDDYTRLGLSIWALLHGTAMLMVVGKTGKDLQAEMRAACIETIEALGTNLESGPTKSGRLP